MLTVACVLSGGEYHPEHAQRLHQQVESHLDVPFEFVCVVGFKLPGFWAKIELFKPGRFKGRVLYFDLDVTIVGGLDEVASYPGPFTAIKDYLNPGINSSVMVWDAGVLDHVYSKFDPSAMERFHGDQDFLNANSQPSRFPKRWFPSWKFDCQDGVPDGAKAVIFHGRPRPWEVKEYA